LAIQATHPGLVVDADADLAPATRIGARPTMVPIPAQINAALFTHAQPQGATRGTGPKNADLPSLTRYPTATAVSAVGEEIDTHRLTVDLTRAQPALTAKHTGAAGATIAFSAGDTTSATVLAIVREANASHGRTFATTALTHTTERAATKAQEIVRGDTSAALTLAATALSLATHFEKAIQARTHTHASDTAFASAAHPPTLPAAQWIAVQVATRVGALTAGLAWATDALAAKAKLAHTLTKGAELCPLTRPAAQPTVVSLVAEVGAYASRTTALPVTTAHITTHALASDTLLIVTAKGLAASTGGIAHTALVLRRTLHAAIAQTHAIAQGATGEVLSAAQLATLFAADRLHHIEDIITPTLTLAVSSVRALTPSRAIIAALATQRVEAQVIKRATASHRKGKAKQSQGPSACIPHHHVASHAVDHRVFHPQGRLAVTLEKGNGT